MKRTDSEPLRQLPQRLISLLTVMMPGLALVAALTGVSYLLAAAPGLTVMGPLVVALIVGLAWRSLAGLPLTAAPGASFSARTLLRVGIVLLGVRLDFALLAQVGPAVLLGSVLVVGLGIFGIERLGKLAGLPRGLRLGIAVGTGICGASAILAAVPATRMKEEEAGVSVGVISALGTVGVLAFALSASLFEPSGRIYGFLVGFTLQEVAQVLAAGYVPGSEAGDLATIVKLTRVALLAPALLVLSALLGGPDRSAAATGAAADAGRSGEDDLPQRVDQTVAGQGSAARSVPAPRRQSALARLRTPVPLFLVGFLAVGVLNSVGWIPAQLAATMQSGSLLLTTAAMVGLGLGLDLAVFRRVGGKALLVGAAGFVGLVAVMLPYAMLVGR